MAESKYEIELVLTDMQGQTATKTLGPGAYLLGRDPECDIRFPAAAKTISRRHARLSVTEDAVAITDLDSRIGTMVNGSVVKEREVENDDVINIASYSIRVKIPERGQRGDSFMDFEELPRVVEVLASDLHDLRAATDKLMAEIGKRIVGQEHILRAIWATMLARGHCLLEGVPGLAKSYIVQTFADVLNLSFQRIQFTPDLMPSDIIGSEVLYRDPDGEIQRRFEEGPIFVNVVLADEINRTPPKTQAALLEAMQEKQVSAAGETRYLRRPFFVLATQNPIEQEGTYPLPEAQLDRFLIKVNLEYPSREDEVQIVLRTASGANVEVQPIFDLPEKDIGRFQSIVANIQVAERMAEYATDLVRASRPEALLDALAEHRPRGNGEYDFIGEWVAPLGGAGPRASQALIRMAKAYAAMDGRPAIAHSDIAETAMDVMRHRIRCTYQARAAGQDAEDIIRQLQELVPQQRGA